MWFQDPTINEVDEMNLINLMMPGKVGYRSIEYKEDSTGFRIIETKPPAPPTKSESASDWPPQPIQGLHIIDVIGGGVDTNVEESLAKVSRLIDFIIIGTIILFNFLVL